MKIKVLGKAHLKGVSKRTGNSYDFYQLHYLGHARGVEGQAALTVSIDPSMFSFTEIKIGGEYNIEFDNRGFVVQFTPDKF